MWFFIQMRLKYIVNQYYKKMQSKKEHDFLLIELYTVERYF